MTADGPIGPEEMVDACSAMSWAQRGSGTRRGPAGDRWVTFTRLTKDPKLAWLEGRLREAGVESRRVTGGYRGAPVLEVRESRLSRAWDVLRPVDAVPEDDPMFAGSR